jgi:hypothetical protein
MPLFLCFALLGHLMHYIWIHIAQDGPTEGLNIKAKRSLEDWILLANLICSVSIGRMRCKVSGDSFSQRLMSQEPVIWWHGQWHVYQQSYEQLGCNHEIILFKPFEKAASFVKLLTGQGQRTDCDSRNTAEDFALEEHLVRRSSYASLIVERIKW